MTIGGRARKRLWGVGMLLLGVGALTACPEQDPVDDILDPGTGTNIAANFIVSSGEGYGMPVASYSMPAVADKFGRVTGNGFFNTDNLWGAPTYNFQNYVRSAADDPRLPALDPATSGTVGGVFCLLGGGDWTGDNYWDFWCRWEGVKPNTVYTVVMAQMYLEINGELDAVQILEGRPVTEPDELKLLPSGTAKGYPDVYCDFSIDVTIPADANPFVFGYVESNATNRAENDCLGYADGSSWWDGAPGEPQPGSLPIMPNEPFTTPQPTYTYNYIYLVEGQGTAENPVPDGPIAARIQVGPDLRSDGLPWFNSWAPFPTEASTAEPAPDIVLEAELLKALAGSGVYQLWLYDSETTTGAPLTARTIEKIDLDTGVEETIGTDATAAVQGGAANEAFRFTVFMDDNAVGAVLDYDYVLLSIEDAIATAPSARTNLYRFFADFSNPALPVIAAAGDMTFGNLDVTTGEPGRTWGFAGDGLAHFFGDQFRAQVSNIVRPTPGYAYYGWLVGTDSEGGAVYYPLGPLTVNNPDTYTPLTDADMTRDIPSAAQSVITQTAIAEAINYNLVEDIVGLPPLAGEPHPFCTVTQYWITLEPKDAADLTEPGPTVAILGAVPETFLKSAACQ